MQGTFTEKRLAMCSPGEDSAEEEDEDGRGAGTSGGEGAEPVGDDDGDDLDEEEEEEGDLELAWKVLETARLIYSKDSNRSLEEVDVMTALADISLEKGNPLPITTASYICTRPFF